MSPLCSPLPGKARKLFFSTSPKTLSPRFNSALVHRGWVSASNWVPNVGLTWGWPHRGPLAQSDALRFSPCQPLSREQGLENSFRGQITWDPCLERLNPSHTWSTIPAEELQGGSGEWKRDHPNCQGHLQHDLGQLEEQKGGHSPYKYKLIQNASYGKEIGQVSGAWLAIGPYQAK